MAYFKLAPNPYEYVDRKEDDWTLAKEPRIKRLKINDENSPKFKKAMSFRLLDLAVLYLFINNRKVNSLTEEENQIIKNASINYEKYSDKKKEKLEELKELILNYNN